jgi:hypothetical protein
MPKRPHEPDDPRHSHNGSAGWSVGSNGLTAAGQSELLKHLGRHLQDSYQNILREPAPDRLHRLMKQLEEDREPNEEP